MTATGHEQGKCALQLGHLVFRQAVTLLEGIQDSGRGHGITAAPALQAMDQDVRRVRVIVGKAASFQDKPGIFVDLQPEFGHGPIGGGWQQTLQIAGQAALALAHGQVEALPGPLDGQAAPLLPQLEQGIAGIRQCGSAHPELLNRLQRFIHPIGVEQGLATPTFDRHIPAGLIVLQKFNPALRRCQLSQPGGAQAPGRGGIRVGFEKRPHVGGRQLVEALIKIPEDQIRIKRVIPEFADRDRITAL